MSGSSPLTEVWSVRELDEARIGPAAPFDPTIDLDDEQVVKLPTSRRGGHLDGEW